MQSHATIEVPGDRLDALRTNWRMKHVTSNANLDGGARRLSCRHRAGCGGRNDLEAGLKDLIYLRASQLNGCTYCVDSHSVELQEGGMPIRKIFAVSAWHESEFFTPRERLALELTEAVTRISEGRVSDDL